MSSCATAPADGLPIYTTSAKDLDGIDVLTVVEVDRG